MFNGEMTFNPELSSKPALICRPGFELIKKLNFILPLLYLFTNLRLMLE